MKLTLSLQCCVNSLDCGNAETVTFAETWDRKGEHEPNRTIDVDIMHGFLVCVEDDKGNAQILGVRDIHMFNSLFVVGWTKV